MHVYTQRRACHRCVLVVGVVEGTKLWLICVVQPLFTAVTAWPCTHSAACSNLIKHDYSSGSLSQHPCEIKRKVHAF